MVRSFVCVQSRLFKFLDIGRDSMDMSCYVEYHLFFFFKQKTAYEMLRSLVGSEMCIRDRPYKCYQCKRCSVGCPVAPFADLHPAQIMRAVQLLSLIHI